jgi:hypothetical protein
MIIQHYGVIGVFEFDFVNHNQSFCRKIETATKAGCTNRCKITEAGNEGPRFNRDKIKGLYQGNAQLLSNRLIEGQSMLTLCNDSDFPTNIFIPV